MQQKRREQQEKLYKEQAIIDAKREAQREKQVYIFVCEVIKYRNSLLCW